MTNFKNIEYFIKENDLIILEDSGNGRNSKSTIISGYAISIGEEDTTTIMAVLNSINLESSTNYPELERVFKVALRSNYGRWWDNEENRKQYKIAI